MLILLCPPTLAAYCMQLAFLLRAAGLPQGFVLCSDNYIGALGAAVIANALSKNKSLRELHMKGNELGDEGVKALCKALKERQSPITSLDFGNNK